MADGESSIDLKAIEQAVEGSDTDRAPDPAETVTARPARKRSRKSARTPVETHVKDIAPQAPSIDELKEKIVANETSTQQTPGMFDMFSNGTDFTDMAKGNVEAMVEAGKVFTSGLQEMGRVLVEDMQGAAEQMQDDAKKMSAVTSPTELFQLQGDLARRNFDAAVAQTSRNVEQVMKLANDMFAPISTRASIAMDKARAA